MIIVQLSGDLGCQMFQYAFGRRLSLIHQTPLKLDIGSFEHTTDNYKLDRFQIQADIADVKDVSQLINLYHLRGGNETQIDASLFPMRTSIEESPYLVTMRDNTYLTGQCWTLSYFAKIAPYLQRELSVKTSPQNENKKFLKQIGKEHAVAVYVYRKPEDENSMAEVSADYYYRAIEAAANYIKRPVFYLFSNDPAWCKEQLSINYPHRFVAHNNAVNEFEDFRLMRACKHQIIANTALCWWAAWLNQSRKKIVVTPKHWHHDGIFPCDFIPDTWFQMEN